MLRIRDVYPRSEFYHPGSRIILTQKKWFLSSWKCDLCCSHTGSAILVEILFSTYSILFSLGCTQILRKVSISYYCSNANDLLSFNQGCGSALISRGSGSCLLKLFYLGSFFFLPAFVVSWGHFYKFLFVYSKGKVQFLHLDPDPTTPINADPQNRIRNPALNSLKYFTRLFLS